MVPDRVANFSRKFTFFLYPQMAYHHVVHSSPALVQSTLFKLKSVLYFFSMVKFTIECWDKVEAKLKTDLVSWTCHSTLLAISGNRIQGT